MKKVLLLSPFFQNEDYPLYLPSENLGIGYLAAYLRHHEVDVDIIDANMEELYAGSLISKISNIHEYSVIGISITFQLIFSEVKNIAKEIKKQNKNVHLTVGGHCRKIQNCLCHDLLQSNKLSRFRIFTRFYHKTEIT